MAGHLLLVVLLCFFSEMRAQALLPPKLTVNPPVITETDSVTLNCQTPSSVSVLQCYFRFVRGETLKSFPCLQNLTGTELLKMSHQSSPAEVKVTCFYLKVHLSPESGVSSITIRTSLPPKLTVNPAVITETDSVTLNCQTPSSVSVSQCYFYTLSGGNLRGSSCLQTLTGTELLKMSQSSAAEVKVICFYTVKLGDLDSPSPHSDTSSIIIHTLLPPKLTVNPPVITETDSVTLNCQTPSSVSVSQCYFYTLSGGSIRGFPCLQTLTGTELLMMSHRSSPAEVKVTCSYTVKFGELDSPSPHSDTSSIIIHRQKPKISLQHFPGEYILFICSLPGSVDRDTTCNLYFGESSHPVQTATIGKKITSTDQWFCHFTVTIDDLLRRLSSVQQSDASCDYGLRGLPNSFSPRSDGYSLTDIVKKESHTTQTMTTFTTTTALTVSTAHTSTLVTPAKQTSETDQTSINPGSADKITGSTVSTLSTKDGDTTLKTASAEIKIWKFVALVAGCGVTVGIIVMASTIPCNKLNKRQAVVDPVEVHEQEPQDEDDEEWNLYESICEEPAQFALNHLYATVQK